MTATLDPLPQAEPDAAAAPPTLTVQRTCPFCEATCGLDVVVEPSTRRVLDVRGDREHVFSRGYICPKAIGLDHLERDPDRLRRPLVKRDGRHVEATWDEAFGIIDQRLRAILDKNPRDSLAVYLGNPNVHNLAGQLYLPVLARALGTRNIFSASTVDQRPKEISSGLMFGTGLTVPVPDVDRTDLLVVLGANPLESNGSLMTAPDMRSRLRRLRERGGRLIVVDPRRTRTAAAADEHIRLRPGADAWLLAAVAQTLLAEGLAAPGRAAEHTTGLDRLPEVLAPFTPEAVAGRCGVPAERIRALARELAAAPSAAVYGRLGTTAQIYGTLASWLVDVVNLLSGNLDREGGALFPRAAAGARNTQGAPGTGRGVRLGRYRSRVRGAAESYGELPVSCLSEEIETPGEGQIRALITVAGNPVLSTPNGARLAAALDTLELVVAVDIYLNETTRHADVILPVPSPMSRAHYDLAFNQLAIRNTATWTPATFPPEENMPDEWETLLRLAGVAMGMGPRTDTAAADDLMALSVAEREVGLRGSPWNGLGATDLVERTAPRRGPARLVDLLLLIGPYGERGATPFEGRGLRLADLEAAPHGIDLGALEPRLPEVLRTPDGRIDAAPQPLLDDLARLRAGLEEDDPELVLIGRRDLRSNNSWMHNVEVLARGERRCTLLVHPADAARHQVEDGAEARLSSRVGALTVTVEVTDTIAQGVVSLPHGWGHDLPGTRMTVATRHAGVNANLLVDEDRVDPLSGNAVLNGVPVSLTPCSPPVADH